MPTRSWITDRRRDPRRLAVFRDCVETHGMESRNPGNEWPWNVLSTATIAFTCGQLARRGQSIEHRHDPAELALCRRLSAEVAATMSGRDVGMGSASGDPFRAYYRVANEGDPTPRRVTERMIHRAFGGTIYPPTRIVIESLAERGDWWRQVGEDGADVEGYLDEWREMIRWFGSHPALHGPAFVQVGDDPLDDVSVEPWNGGCVFPRLAVALTEAGSLVGIGGWVVHA
jgi:hypothetical protein